MKDPHIENNNTEEPTTFPLDDIFPFFTDHIDQNDNARIFFSGKFGIGKTHFLKEYFKNFEDQYEVFHLFPVNYQISSNEDVIELLKYDILTELLNKDENLLEQKDYNNLRDLSTMAYLWGKENYKGIFKTAVSLIPKLGKPLNEVIGFYESFNTFKEQLRNPELNTVNNFLSFLKSKDMLETDLVSQLLKEKIEKIKADKQSVLILDDLDRIDPEHIFRILNVFSSQFDTANNQVNKFGFDKIILVADYRNIRSIFAHKYGNETDFSGYLDKFFSTEVFEFSNQRILKKAINKLIDKYKESTRTSQYDLSRFKELLNTALTESINMSTNLLTFREVIKQINKIYTGERFDVDSASTYIEIRIINSLLKTLTFIFGSESKLIVVLKQILLNSKNTVPILNNKYTDVLINKLRYLFNTDPSNNLPVSWEQYSFTYDASNRKTIKHPDYKNASYVIFFDLLITYIQEKLHEKELYE